MMVSSRFLLTLIQPIAATAALLSLLIGFVGPMAEVQAQTLPCNYRNLIVTNYPNAGVVAARTGGVGFITGSVTNPGAVVDASVSNSATIGSLLGVGSGGQLSVSPNQNGGTTVFGAGATAGYVVGNNGGLGTNLLASITIRTYLSGTFSESSTASSLMSL